MGMRGVLGGRLSAAAVIVAMTMLSGCGDEAADEADPPATPEASVTSSTPMSTTPPPTQQSPMEPPSTPSDPKPHDVVAGHVVRGGAGPCFGVVTDDGKLYAVHSPSTGELAVGTTVLVKIGPAVADVDCGPGEPITASRIDVVG